MNPNLGPEARAACLELLRRGLIQIRVAVRSGDHARAEAIADALHNLPQLLAEGDRYGWTIPGFRQAFLAGLIANYPDLRGWDSLLQSVE